MLLLVFLQSLPQAFVMFSGLDWKRFLEENEIDGGNVCTINIVETTVTFVTVSFVEKQRTLLFLWSTLQSTKLTVTE